MNSETMPLVSIVTPMYNEAKHLAECIDSILGQTHRNWEYIIVDNCSTDGSCEIANCYAEKDNRIRVLKNSQFMEAIPNHNAALRNISPKSKYCKVVFADDWIFPDCLERMVSVAEAHPSIGIVGAYGLEGSRVVWTGLPYPGALVAGNDICRRLFLDGLYVFGTATSVLYRADLVRDREPFYDVMNIHSDMETCIILLKHCDFGFVHQVLTFTRVRDGSLITISRNINTVAAGQLIQLVRHGQHFLTPHEFCTNLRQSLSEYYWYLAGSFVRGRDKSFWDYHKRTFAEAGLGFSRVRLAIAVVARMAYAATHMKDTIQALRATWSRALQRSPLTDTDPLHLPSPKPE